MLAIVTGASSGIGFEIAKVLSNKGYDIIAIGRNIEKLMNLKSICDTKVYIENLDLTDLENCKKIYEKYKKEKIDILVNSAGIGAVGNFFDISLEKELEMIDLNINSLHYLTKIFLCKMKNENYGYILNVSSSAAFAPGPLMATYYATKSYVFKLTQAINKELKKAKSKVQVSVLCPGPVKSDFNKRMNVDYSVNPISAEYVAKYSINKLFKGKSIIIPGIISKIGVFFSKLLPYCLLEEYVYNMQNKKIKSK